MGRYKKLRVYEACIASKLMYCLGTVDLNAAEVRKLDAFHHRCLRRIDGVKPSYVSRVSNKTVRDTLRAKPLKQVLLKRQLLYFGPLARKPPDYVLINFVFNPSTVTLRPLGCQRRKGRPRANWNQYLYKLSLMSKPPINKKIG